jgi:hypothetical protein
MKVSELPKGSNLTLVKVRLSDEQLTQYKAYNGGEQDMWIVGETMGDFFLSPHPPNMKGERRLYPIPITLEPQFLLKCEVVENLN